MSLELVKTAANLTTDTLVTIRTDDSTYEGRVGKVYNRQESVRATILDIDTYDSLGTVVCRYEIDTEPKFQNRATPSHEREDETCVSIETHGVDVDWEQPVRSTEGGLTYVVDCEECGGLMKRDGQYWPRSSESYACEECDNTGRWSRSADAVRKPTRYEWAVHTLNQTSAFLSIPDRYIPEGFELPGYYFREACKSDASHYTRTEVSETGSASHHQFDDLKLGVCPECGAETTRRTKQYEDGMETWGEPENHGGLSEETKAMFDRVESGEVELFIPNDPDEEGWSYTYEGVSFTCPWHGYEDGVYLRLEDGKMYVDIETKGGNYVGGYGGFDVGEVAWWLTNTDRVKQLTLA